MVPDQKPAFDVQELVRCIGMDHRPAQMRPETADDIALADVIDNALVVVHTRVSVRSRRIERVGP